MRLLRESELTGKRADTSNMGLLAVGASGGTTKEPINRFFEGCTAHFWVYRARPVVSSFAVELTSATYADGSTTRRSQVAGRNGSPDGWETTGVSDMKIRLAALALAAATLAGCTTTEEANNIIQSRWIGQPAELFFSRYGPPVSEFRTGSGNTIYTWRGGEKTQYIPAQYSTPDEQPVYGKTVTKTTDRKSVV